MTRFTATPAATGHARVHSANFASRIDGTRRSGQDIRVQGGSHAARHHECQGRRRNRDRSLDQ